MLVWASIVGMQQSRVFSLWGPYRCKWYIFRECVCRAHYFDSLSYERKLKVLRNNHHPFCGLCIIVWSTRRTQQVMPIEPVHPHSLVWALAARRCDTYLSLMRWLKRPQVWVVRSHSLPVLLKNYMCIMHGVLWQEIWKIMITSNVNLSFIFWWDLLILIAIMF